MAVQLTDSLREEYSQLFDTCNIRPGKESAVESAAAAVLANRSRYESVAGLTGVPWYVIGAVHSLESSLKFTAHLHNGDPLSAPTVHVPKGRPPGPGPFTWEQSATDALKLQKMDQVTDWSIPGILFQVEKYNGFGYRTKHPEVLSPYLWSYSVHYKSGKYVADGTFDPDAVSKQCGAAVILRRFSEQGVIQFDAAGKPAAGGSRIPADPISALGPLVIFSETAVSESAKKLQQGLNMLPGIFLKVDGIPGRRTSDAFRRVTGHFLSGDPRAKAAVAGP